MRTLTTHVPMAIVLAAATLWIAQADRGQAEDCAGQCPQTRSCPNYLAPCVAKEVAPKNWTCSPTNSSVNLTGPFWPTQESISWNDAPDHKPLGEGSIECYRQYICTLNFNNSPPTCAPDTSTGVISSFMYGSATTGCTNCP